MIETPGLPVIRYASAASCRPVARGDAGFQLSSIGTPTSQASHLDIDRGQMPAFFRLIVMAIRKKIIPNAIWSRPTTTLRSCG